MLLEQLLHNCGENSLRDGGAHFDIMLSILKDLWLDDWHESVLLADRSVSGEGVSGLLDGGLGWASISNLEDGSPFGESASQGIVLSASLSKSIKSLSCSLSIGATDWHESSVDLDTAVNASSSQDLSEFL